MISTTSPPHLLEEKLQESSSVYGRDDVHAYEKHGPHPYILTRGPCRICAEHFQLSLHITKTKPRSHRKRHFNPPPLSSFPATMTLQVFFVDRRHFLNRILHNGECGCRGEDGNQSRLNASANLEGPTTKSAFRFWPPPSQVLKLFSGRQTHLAR